MKRHGENQNLENNPMHSTIGLMFRQPITELVNGTFGVSAASSPCFRRGFTSIDSKFACAARNFKEL
jgi:hypothetical protein